MGNQMKWEKLLSPLRLGAENENYSNIDITRSQFQRDYDRIIFSSPFRRLQNKTQVFPLPGSVFVHNRLTHSLEVASVGRTLGNLLVNIIRQKEGHDASEFVGEIPIIVSTASLAHDLGNPPFGHSGEEAIRKYFIDHANFYEPLISDNEWLDLTRYEGNANAFRLLTQQLKGRRSGGFRLSYSTLASLVKYPHPSTSKGKKFGFFQSEAEIYSRLATRLEIPLLTEDSSSFVRHPLVYLVEAADDICYQIMDIEDAHKLGILNTTLVKELYLNFFDQEQNSSEIDKIVNTLNEVTDTNEQISFLRALVISKLISDCSQAFSDRYDQILNGEQIPSLIDCLEGHVNSAMNKVKAISFEQVYNHKTVIEIELSGYRIIGLLLDNFCKAIIEPNNPYYGKILRLLPEQYRCSEGTNYQKLMSVLDFISGMTDLYALEQFRILQGISLPGIPR
jgi:dGTPase